MNDYIKTFEELFDKEWFKKHATNLYRIERKQTFPAYEKSARYIYNLLKEEGFEAEYLEFKADGKTAFQDKCIPIGWDVSKMKLTLTSDVPGIEDRVIADYQREPIHAVKHSTATPHKGLDVPIITEGQMKVGANVSGALVLLDMATPPRMSVMRMLLDLGAVGWVSDYSENPNTNPDGIFWANSATEYGSWSVLAGDRDFISFQISEKCGYYLRRACEKESVFAHIESDGRRYEAVMPAVTGLLKGESEKEIWIMAHTCEPLFSDDSTGVIASVAMLKALKELSKSGSIKLKYSVRVVFASELYGMSAVCDYFGGNLKERAIGGINMDGFTSSVDKSAHKIMRSVYAADLPGFAGNILLDLVDDNFLKNHPEFEVEKALNNLGDDTFFNDSTIGMPVVWICHNRYGYHHNSAQDETLMDTNAAQISFAYSAEWVRAMAALTEEEVSRILPYAVKKAEENLENEAKAVVRKGTDVMARMEFMKKREVSRIKMLSLWSGSEEIQEAAEKIKMPENTANICKDIKAVKWFDYADNFIFKREGPGLPHDLIRIPKEIRNMEYGGMLYSPFAEVFSKMDGKKTLKDAIIEAEWDKNMIFDDKFIKKWLYNCVFYSGYGYLEMKVKNKITGEDIKKALLKVGVKNGETLLVHSGLSDIGYIEGGEDTVIKAISGTVGKDGTFIAPVFTLPYISYDGDVNKGYFFRPYDTRPDGVMRDKTVRTGALGKAMLKKKEAFRSGNATHEWVAIGKEAKECTAGHGLLDIPTGKTSPLKKALDRRGSVVFLGCDPGSNTFIHYAEIEAKINYAEPAGVQYVDSDGHTKTVMMDGELFGCRNFYDGAESEFYKRAKEKGLEIHETKLGMATVYRIELRKLYEITMDMFKSDPYATLCKKKDCKFCQRFIKEL